jgi:TolB-like protein/Tfp pilus assembly protein PilF
LTSLERDRIPPVPISTGYADLDRLLFGGLPPNSAIALTSPACSERDLLVKCFLETGARNGEVTFYVTIDPSAVMFFAERFPSNFRILVCNPQADAIVRDLPDVLKLKGVENLTDVSMALTSAIRKLDPLLKTPRRICLGLISDVLLQHHAVQTRRWLTSVLTELKSTGFTTLAVIDPQMHPSEELHAILGLFDGDISVYERETERGLERYLKIKKLSNQKYLGDKLPLRVEEPKVKPEESMTGQTVLDKHRVAVLPLVNMSPDPNDEYFADGMTEEIISTVSGISGLRVISRTSVMGYKGTTKKVEEIGKELKVGSVLEGSFRKAGNRIRVTTQLINVADDEHLWAQNYDRNLNDVFEVQSDVAKQVAEALRVRILSSEKERMEKKPTESTTAYSLYLRGRYHWNKRGPQDLKKAMEYFEQAVHEDPNFALGYAGQADCAVVLYTWTIDREENLAKAKAIAEKALQFDPALAEAHATLGEVYELEYDLRGAEEEFKKAIALKPSYATAHQWYSQLLRLELRWDEDLKESEKAVELDPLSGIIIQNLGLHYSARKDFGKAVEKYRSAVELGLENAHSGLFWAYGMMKMYDQMDKEAEACARYFQNIAPRVRTRIDADKAYLKGDKKTVRKLLPELETNPKETLTQANYIADYHFFLGDIDKGFEWLERAYSNREDGLLGIQLDWDLDGVRTDPRYLDLLKRLGLNQTAQPTS